MLHNLEVGSGIMARGIRTATVYAAPDEWQRFKTTAAAEFRGEAGQLAAIAKLACQNDNFRMIERPEGCKPGTQIKTEAASPYLIQLAQKVERETGRKVTLSEVVESLVRSLSIL